MEVYGDDNKNSETRQLPQWKGIGIYIKEGKNIYRIQERRERHVKVRKETKGNRWRRKKQGESKKRLNKGKKKNKGKKEKKTRDKVFPNSRRNAEESTMYGKQKRMGEEDKEGTEKLMLNFEETSFYPAHTGALSAGMTPAFFCLHTWHLHTEFANSFPSYPSP